MYCNIVNKQLGVLCSAPISNNNLVIKFEANNDYKT